MSEKKEIFADGIGQIHFAGGMVRFDFVTLNRRKKDKLQFLKPVHVSLCRRKASLPLSTPCSSSSISLSRPEC